MKIRPNQKNKVEEKKFEVELHIATNHTVNKRQINQRSKQSKDKKDIPTDQWKPIYKFFLDPRINLVKFLYLRRIAMPQFSVQKKK